jgi:alkylation response protein AidB-like acyl-CoA dehydrogenase
VNLRDDEREHQLRVEIRAWLDENVPSASARLAPMASGAEALERMMQWQQRVFAAGWAGITVPKRYGGRGGEVWQQNIWNEEAVRAGLSPGMLSVALGMVVPTLLAMGSDQQKERYIEPILRGEAMWSQLFSEPEAGSDLASLRTTARRDGDTWVVQGQKVWTSEAQHADHAILLARTGSTEERHRGLTYFLVDMRSEGIEIRPLVDMSGEHHFNEVFLDGLRVPLDAVVGEVGGGWAVATATLNSERAVIGGGMWGLKFSDIAELARSAGRTSDPAVRQTLARVYEGYFVLEALRLRARSGANSQSSGPEAAVLKLLTTLHMCWVANVAVDLLGVAGLLTGEDAPEGDDWARLLVRSFSLRFAGGTSEIQRNVLAERLLGLPRDPRPLSQVSTKSV